MSRVITAEAWPSIGCTALAFAPLATSRLAAVCRRSCGLRSPSPAVLAAGAKNRRRKLHSALLMGLGRPVLDGAAHLGGALGDGEPLAQKVDRRTRRAAISPNRSPV